MADVVDKAWDKTFRIRGGNDLLPTAFTTALGDVVKRGCIVQALAQDASGVTVTYAQEGIARNVRADLAICTLPFTTLRKVDLSNAGFGSEKSALITSMRYMPVSRFNQQTKTRFWQEKGIGGLKVARTDGPIERLWDMSNVQDGDRGILTAYMMGANGLAFAKVAESDRSDYFAKNVRTFFPEIDAQMEKSATKIWQDDPWVFGGWAYYQKGELGQGMPLSKRREGRVFFCGEHTSPWSGWMQGAFESANRVVAEITNGA
jgi:monoamine oxidase